MESRNIQNHVDCEDRFSKLPDEILLYILDKTNIHTSIRASSLSTRWKHLPSLLPHISLDISDFMPSKSTPVEQILLGEAMTAMTKAARTCLAAPGKESTMKSVSLHLCLAPKYLHDIGMIVCEAIDNHKVKNLELDLPTEKFSLDCDVGDLLQHASDLIYLFEASPNLFRSLTRLFLHNVYFEELQMHHLFDSAEQLQYLILNTCDFGDAVLSINMPNSKISCLIFSCCYFEKVEFICLPKLTELHFVSWSSVNAPFSFGFVPRLKILHLACPAKRYQSGLSLSELLPDTTEIQTLNLDFQGEKIWMLPEGKRLYTLFNKLNKLFMHGVYVKFGLLWTTALLEAAPSLKTFGIKVWDHVCDSDSESRKRYSIRTNPWQENSKSNNFKHLQLTRLELGGYMVINKHRQFIRAVMDCAPNLETILLEDKDPCEACDEVYSVTCSPADSMFPKEEYEQDMVLTQLEIGACCSVDIIFK